MSLMVFPRGEKVLRPAGLFAVPHCPVTGSVSRLAEAFRRACCEEWMWLTPRDHPVGSLRVPRGRGPAVVRWDFQVGPGPPPDVSPRGQTRTPGKAAPLCPGSGEMTMRRRPGSHRSTSHAAVLPRHRRQPDAPVGMPGSLCAHRRSSEVSGHWALSGQPENRAIRNVGHPNWYRGVSGWWRGIFGGLPPRSAPATEPAAARRGTVRVGRRFSGTPAKRF